MMSQRKRKTVGPIDAFKVPRFAGPSTFARLPTLDEVGTTDIAVVGVPFDSGVTYRPGARFGPSAIRAASKLIRPYHPGLQVAPFDAQQVADAGDIPVTPFNIGTAIAAIEDSAKELGARARCLLSLGGDHTIALPMLRAIAHRSGPVAVLHFDAHLDTWKTYFGAEYTHGTPFRRASEEGLLAIDSCMHVGIRGPLFAPSDLVEDEMLGFKVIDTMTVASMGIAATAGQIRQRLGNRPVYVSVDIDVLDPAHAPGTGTPEAGGLSSRELLFLLRELHGLTIVGADIVEVAPAYDHAEITAIAAAHVAYELLAVLASVKD
jgi:agmatinase